MIYTTYENLSDCIRQNIWKIPADVDLIVGVPRSGMIPSLMIAELLNKRCATLDEFCEGRTMSCGNRESLMRNNTIKKVLVIDDTVYAGTTMQRIRERLAPLESQYNIIYATVYAEGRHAKEKVDLYLYDIWKPGERMWLYEWNVLHHYGRKTESSMWDIDGLICKDPPDDQDVIAYESYLPVALPMIIPTTKIGAIVTYRLEKYRAVTEQWLQRHGIDYGQLLMFPAFDREERNRIQHPSRYKAKIYSEASWAKIFYESSRRQAERIHNITGKPVFCYENGKMYI